MLVIGMAAIFGGYTVASYGWVLLKGWNIPFRQWISPLNPYQWPAGDPECIPPNALFPKAGQGVPCNQAGAGPGGGTNPLPTPKGLTQPEGSRSFINPNQAPFAK